jgi:hypothetical protein
LPPGPMQGKLPTPDHFLSRPEIRRPVRPRAGGVCEGNRPGGTWRTKQSADDYKLAEHKRGAFRMSRLVFLLHNVKRKKQLWSIPVSQAAPR